MIAKQKQSLFGLYLSQATCNAGKASPIYYPYNVGMTLGSASETGEEKHESESLLRVLLCATELIRSTQLVAPK